MRARSVDRAEGWRWGSLFRWLTWSELEPKLLSPWPAPRLPNWVKRVNEPLSDGELQAVRDTYGLTDRVLGTKEYAVPALAPMVNGVIWSCSTEGILMLLRQSGSRATDEQIARYVPVVGTVIAASMGFAVTWKVGTYYLNDCHKPAAAVLDARLRASQDS